MSQGACRPWTMGEIKRLKEMRDRGVSNSQAAAELGRSVAAVESAVSRRGWGKPKAPRKGKRPYAPRGEVSAGDALVLAAKELRRRGQSVFSVEDLAIAAWESFPRALGMKAHPHPDMHRVVYTLCGKWGPIRRGVLVRRPDGRLELGED